jgi:hypothetical protein
MEMSEVHCSSISGIGLQPGVQRDRRTRRRPTNPKKPPTSSCSVHLTWGERNVLSQRDGRADVLYGVAVIGCVVLKRRWSCVAQVAGGDCESLLEVPMNHDELQAGREFSGEDEPEVRQRWGVETKMWYKMRLRGNMATKMS